MSILRPKTFLEALKLVHSNPKKAKTFLQDKRLSLAEKKILNSWFHLKNCLHSEIIKEIENLAVDSELVESQKILILGLTYNNMGELNQASVLLHKAFELIEKHPLPEHQFICLYNLFIISYNLGHEKDMFSTLDLMDVLATAGLNERQAICHLQSKFNYLTFKNQFEEASHYLEELELKKAEMTDPVIMSHLISKFQYFLKQSLFDYCEATMQEMKKYRLFRHTPNFIFMRLSLDHIIYNRPLYFYEKDFKDSKLLFHQLKVIKSFEESNFQEAEKYWRILSKTDSNIYQDNFVYKGQVNLFSLCLSKYKIQKQQSAPMPELSNKNKSEAIVKILQSRSYPIPKEELFEALWGRKPVDQTDDDKLKNLIYYVRKNKGLVIGFRKGCYSLKTSSKGDKVA